MNAYPHPLCHSRDGTYNLPGLVPSQSHPPHRRAFGPALTTKPSQNARPNLTYAKVSDRLALSRAYTTDLSNYFRERAALEDSYVKSLHKLAARLHGTGSGAVMTAVEALGLERKEEERQLGAWKGVRDRLEGEVTETARVHDVWSRKVIDEVEGPLRFSLGKPDWMRYQQGEASLGATVREYDSTLDKVQKVSILVLAPAPLSPHSSPPTIPPKEDSGGISISVPPRGLKMVCMEGGM